MLIASFDKTIHTCKIVRIVLVDIYFNGKMFYITQTCPCNIQQYFTAVKMINFR